MKKFYTIATALLLVAGTFTGCTKDLDEVGPMSATESQAAKVVTANNTKVEADLLLSFSPATQMVGNSVTITASFGSNAPSDGKVHIEQATGVDAEGQIIWSLAKAYEVSAGGPFTHVFSSDVTGSFEFRAHYIPQGNNGFKTTFKTGSVAFVETCVQGMTAAVVDSEDLGNNVYRLTVAFTLTTCSDYNDVKIQGGLTAKSSNVSALNGEVIRNTHNDNYIINWIEPSLAKGAKTYYVTFDKEIKGAGMVTGDWSAKTADGSEVAKTEGAYFDPAN